MADVHVRLAGPVLLTDAAATVYTVAANKTVTVRGIHVANGAAVSANFTMSVGADALGLRFYDAQPIPAHGALDWSGILVLQAAELIQAYASAANALQFTISGVVTA